MFKKYYSKDIEKIAVNTKMRDALRQQLFQKPEVVQKKPFALVVSALHKIRHSFRYISIVGVAAGTLFFIAQAVFPTEVASATEAINEAVLEPVQASVSESAGYVMRVITFQPLVGGDIVVEAGYGYQEDGQLVPTEMMMQEVIFEGEDLSGMNGDMVMPTQFVDVSAECGNAVEFNAVDTNAVNTANDISLYTHSIDCISDGVALTIECTNTDTQEMIFMANCSSSPEPVDCFMHATEAQQQIHTIVPHEVLLPAPNAPECETFIAE